MFQNKQLVLVDTNVIIEAHRCGCWNTLANYFAIHTVDQVVLETQTGFQNRRPEENIDEATLRKSCARIAEISDGDRAAFHAAFPGALLDPGERDLLVYAGTVQGGWLLNSPDVAAVRHCHSRGWLDRVVSLEAMNAHLRGRLKDNLRDNYTQQWLSAKKLSLIL